MNWERRFDLVPAKPWWGVGPMYEPQTASEMPRHTLQANGEAQDNRESRIVILHFVLKFFTDGDNVPQCDGHNLPRDVHCELNMSGDITGILDLQIGSRKVSKNAASDSIALNERFTGLSQ